MRYPYNSILLYFCLATPVFAVEFDVSGQVQMATGVDENVYFKNDHSKDGAYGSGRLRLRTDAIFSPTIRFNTEIQTGDTIGKDWSDHKGITTGFYSKKHEHFSVRMAHLAWDIPSYDSRLDIGIENISLPSATFGNPILDDANLGGVVYHKTFKDNDKMQMFIARSIYSHDYIQALYTAGMMFELKWADLTLEPYYLYAYYEYHDDTNFGFVDKLEKSYMNVAGVAGTYNITNKVKFKFDLLYGDQNNEVVHYYETKGHHAAVILDYDADYSTLGLFAWHSSGNDNKLDEHDDFGFAPVISTGGFAPTRLGFRSKDGFGRQGVISETGIGTAGVGFHIKDIHTTEKLTHTFRAAYITGTTSGHGEGAPVSATVPSLVLAHGEAGFMTDKDHAVEFNFDSVYEINKNLVASVDVGYIVSGYDNKTYDKNPFNV